ncbi:MAG: sugar ABC transporter substrate-binding protein [Anaerolineaceae bacterium]|nr:sugar ABC transporter substrate-binding protein [Anaerolineaceae bacterium]
MKRMVFLLFATLLLCLAVAPLAAQDEEPLQLTYLHWADPVADVVFQELIDQFNEANPDVFITLEGVPNAGYVDYLLTSIAGGTPPDIALVADGDFAVFAPRGALVSIEEFVNASEVIDLDAVWPSGPDRYRFHPETGAFMTGPIYELPRDVGPTALYINVDLFNELGVPLPDPNVPMTWDQLVETGIALTTDANGLHPNEEGFDADNVETFGLGTLTVPGWGLGPIFGNGGHYVSEDGRTWIAHEDQNTIDAMQFLSDLNHVHRITPPPGVLEGINVWDLFNTGRVGMNWNGRWATTGFRETLDFEWDVRPFPVGSSGEIRAFAEGCSVSGWSGSVGLAIIAGSTGAENPEKAYRFIEFIYGPDGQLAQAALGYNIPAQMELANTDAFLQPGQMPANSQVFLETTRCQLPGPWSFVPHWFVWQPEPWGRMWQAVVVENSAFAEDALLDVAGDLQAGLDDAWATIDEQRMGG